MPIYEYRCRDCGKEFEYQQRMSDDPKTVCESCGGGLEKLISRSAFQFKGGGWYKDLYASSKKPDSGGSTESTSTSSAGSPSTSSGSTGSTGPAGSSGGATTPSTSSGSSGTSNS